MSLIEKFDEAVAAALSDGLIDEIKQGPIIEAARKVAIVMDEPEWPIVRGRIDNVSPSVFLKYCDKLGLAPDVELPKKKKEEPPAEGPEKVVQLVGSSKWKKASHG